MNRILNGRYRIDGVVGDGGMAVVYRGWDLVLNRVVAIKVLREQYATNDSFLARFRREAQSAAGLSHPNIVNVYDVGRDGDTWYIVQELIDGTDLATLIRQRGQFTVPDAIEVMTQIAPALDYAHSHGIIHRDIKPHNILIDARGTAKVVDFGIAKGVNDIKMTDAGTALGTAGYISPEQATGSPLTAASDLYSAGVVLYEMLTGRLPFVGDTAVSVAMQHVRNAPPPPSRFNAKIPRHVEAVILRAMEKLPDRRYLSGAEMVSALRGNPVPGPVQTVAIAGGAGAYAQPEDTRALAMGGPRARTATVAPTRSSTRRVDATPVPRRTTGPGIGTWLLGIVLLGGLLALVYLGYKLANASN
ncbi:MAG TPA: protein kinase, partial [Thermomicrobiales bacterium]